MDKKIDNQIEQVEQRVGQVEFKVCDEIARVRTTDEQIQVLSNGQNKLQRKIEQLTEKVFVLEKAVGTN